MYAKVKLFEVFLWYSWTIFRNSVSHCMATLNLALCRG